MPLNAEKSPLLAIDPGREKCGLAVVGFDREIIHREIVETQQLPLRVAHFVGRFGIELIVLGDRTTAQETRETLRRSGFRLEIVFVDEDRSSELGRRRYLLDHPGEGWQRFLPVGLRSPDQAYDDYVAVILAERYLDGQRSTRQGRQRRKRKEHIE
ncbi:MAG: hypothetical protein WCJ56_04315 [bacterium]